MDIAAGISVAACALAGLAAGGVVAAAVTWLPGWPPGTLRGAWRCPACGDRLRLSDLVPVTGWRALAARCPVAGWTAEDGRALTAGAPIPGDGQQEANAHGDPSGRLPSAELASEAGGSVAGAGRTVAAGLITVVAVAVMGVRFGARPMLLAFCFFAAVSVALAVIDARWQRLPDALTLPSYPVAVVLLTIAATTMHMGWAHLLSALAGLAACWLVFLAQALIYPAGIGWGDVKLSGLAGLYLGWLGLHAVIDGVLLSYLLALAAGIGLVVARRAGLRTRLAFGPYLLAGTLAVIVASGYLGALRGPLL